MGPHEVITCNLLRAKLSAESCARRYLARVGIHGVPKYIPCGSCTIGASVSTRLIDAGWTPSRDGAAARQASPHL